MEHSQNGWPASKNTADLDILWYAVPGSGGIRLPLAKKAAPLLLAAAAEFHKTVEGLHDGWCWGYAYRDIRGVTGTLSNHASGTAMDLNAPRHPLGVPASRNFSPAQIKRCQQIAVKYGLSWGGDWISRPDAMHFEIDVTPAQAKALIDRLNLDPWGNVIKPLNQANFVPLKFGSTGREVAQVQKKLQARGFVITDMDGYFGATTMKAVKEFRRRHPSLWPVKPVVNWKTYMRITEGK